MQAQPATVCTGIQVNDMRKCSQSHTSWGHRYCSHLACPSCCNEFGLVSCPQHKKLPLINSNSANLGAPMTPTFTYHLICFLHLTNPITPSSSPPKQSSHSCELAAQQCSSHSCESLKVVACHHQQDLKHSVAQHTTGQTLPCRSAKS
ncbi:hypothetical protein CROQUDRAFT_332852 [Cronartium quercuum f. sp. fusiforme G11]|uniref:Uncharacterized protein n=1 Tax=Cronartium quercuum f. sp. fusiforme G11 TaxID=708437 RepID=A0A9P6NTY9_9BASI|nr:hypothetical protein CROQUDRAFT_332852 [Cronartium quercuum f. sp. fusiforme G11]